MHSNQRNAILVFLSLVLSFHGVKSQVNDGFDVVVINPISIVEAVSVATNITLNEYTALVDFYFSTNGNYWNNSKYWLSNVVSPCNWYGIVCDETLSHVAELLLPANNLSGVLPQNSIGNLFRLATFNINSNRVGGEIGDSLASIKSLSEILLSRNAFQGDIPTSFGQLIGYSFSLFDASHNMLSGFLPGWISVAPSYGVSVYLSNNPFSCPIPTSDLYTGATCIDVSISNVQPSCYQTDALVLVYGGPWLDQDLGLYCKFHTNSTILGSEPVDIISSNLLSCSTPSNCGDRAPTLQIVDYQGNPITTNAWNFGCRNCVCTATNQSARYATRKYKSTASAQDHFLLLGLFLSMSMIIFSQ